MMAWVYRVSADVFGIIAESKRDGKLSDRIWKKLVWI